jgi:hypothetical protein
MLSDLAQVGTVKLSMPGLAKLKANDKAVKKAAAKSAAAASAAGSNNAATKR